MTDCIFCKIASGEIGKLIYEDNIAAAFDDVNPQAPVHFLVIPKKHIERLSDIVQGPDADLAGHLLAVAAKLAKDRGISDRGYRTVINCNEGAGQSVWHLHVHVLGGRDLSWPPG